MEQLTYQDVKKQSEAVFGQFGHSKWIPYAKENCKHPNRKDANDLAGKGVGKVLLCVALGASLEEQAEIIKKYRHKIDIICVDKALKPLLEHGIKPDYVMLCDCNIVWQKWGPKEEETEGISLIATPYANLDWTRKWRGPIYFYCNRDAIGSEKIFTEIMGENTRTIPASSNVGNAQLVFMTGNDEWNIGTFSGYEKYILIGYDFSWKLDRNYYAWSNPKPKRYYMNHLRMIDKNFDMVFTSENLKFSAKWMNQYIRAWKLNVVNCSGGILDTMAGVLEKELSAINTSKTNEILRGYDLVKNVKRILMQTSENLNKSRQELIYASR